MENVVLYGAGKICSSILPIIALKYNIIAIIDKNESLHGKMIYDIPVIGIEKYMELYFGYKVIISSNEDNTKEIRKNLEKFNITNYFSYSDVISEDDIDTRERIVSYSMPNQMEDVILYNVFKDEKKIFYIDVGSNDPLLDSVTRLLYDKKNARGINIEPQQKLIDITNVERPEDINICIGLGEKDDTVDFYVQGDDLCGISTAESKNINEDYFKNKTTIQITTLKKICDKYVKEKEISFLKIDVEGYERNVLLGADFKKYRPMIIVMESTFPMTDIPCHDLWEDILIDNNYHCAFSFGVNRYYVADENSELDKKFIPILEVLKKYKIFHIR